MLLPPKTPIDPPQLLTVKAPEVPRTRELKVTTFCCETPKDKPSAKLLALTVPELKIVVLPPLTTQVMGLLRLTLWLLKLTDPAVTERVPLPLLPMDIESPGPDEANEYAPPLNDKFLT